MSRYIEKSLGNDEVILIEGRFPTLYWIAAWTSLILLGPLIIGLLIFARLASHLLSTEFAVTSHRVVLKHGLFNRTTQEIAIESVEGVELHQSLIGRLLNYGRLRVRGTGEALINFPNMHAPVSFRAAIENAREEAAKVHIDADALHDDLAAAQGSPPRTAPETSVEPGAAERV